MTITKKSNLDKLRQRLTARWIEAPTNRFPKRWTLRQVKINRDGVVTQGRKLEHWTSIPSPKGWQPDNDFLEHKIKLWVNLRPSGRGSTVTWTFGERPSGMFWEEVSFKKPQIDFTK